MAPPSQETITAAIQALRHDAQVWRHAGADLRTAADAADRLTLDAGDFSYVGDLTGLTAVYGRLQRHLALLLGEGSAGDDDIAAALSVAADGYERDEANAVHRMRQIW